MPPSAEAGRSSLLGVACVVGAGFAFTTNDMAIKWLSGDYPLHQIILARSVIAVLLTLAILVPLEGGYRNLLSSRWRLHLLRGGAVVLANMAFFLGLASLPLGEATAIFFVAPLLITALSAVMLAERIGPRRSLAVLVGFAGVLVMLRPGTDAFKTAALLPLAAALCYALVQILTRKLGNTERASTMAVYIQVCFVIVSGGFGLVAGDGRFAGPDAGPQIDFLLRAWVWPPASDAAIMLALGLLSSLGGYLMSQGYRLSEAALAAPFEYAALPLAVFWSVLIWGDWPEPVAWLGIALICGAGLFVFYRESTLGKRIALRRPMPRNR